MYGSPRQPRDTPRFRQSVPEPLCHRALALTHTQVVVALPPQPIREARQNRRGSVSSPMLVHHTASAPRHHLLLQPGRLLRLAPYLVNVPF